MKKVRMIVEMDEKAYKALIGQEVFNIWKGNTILSTIFNAIKTATPLTECDDTVSRGVFEQVMWERDTAIEQLRELGYDLGQKIEPCDDCVSRSAVLDYIDKILKCGMGKKKSFEFIRKFVEKLSSVTPKREKNTVSEEVYTEEYTRRKALEYENYVLKQNMQALK